MPLKAKQVNFANSILAVIIWSVCSFLIFFSNDPFLEGLLLVVLSVSIFDLGRTIGKYDMSTKYNQMIEEKQFQEKHPKVRTDAKS